MAIYTSDVIDEVLEKLRLNKTSPVAVTRPQVLREFNNCLRDLAEHTYMFIANSQSAITILADVATYSWPTDMYDIIRMYDSDSKTIYPTTVEQLEEMSRDWVAETGTPTHFIMNFTGINTFRLYPIPTSEDATDTIGVTYRKYYPDYTDSGSVVIPIPNSKSLYIDWCLGKLLMARTEVQDQQMAQAYLSGYYNERKRWENRPKAPEKQRIVGIRGEQPGGITGPGLPNNYPSLRLWE
jgi:hypothetical protein